MSNAGRPTNWRQIMSALPDLGTPMEAIGIQSFDRAVASAISRRVQVSRVGTERRVMIGRNSTHEWVACIDGTGSGRVLVTGPSFDDDGVETTETREIKITTDSDMPFYIGHW